MTKIIWSGPAIRELEAALDFIALDNPEAADRLGRAIHQAVGRLRAFPESARMVPELENPRIREVVHGPFRVVYEVRDDLVEILATVRSEQNSDFEEIAARGSRKAPSLRN